MTSDYLAEHVRYIIGDCVFGSGLTGGQAFNTDGMNVIVKQEDNCDYPSLQSKRELPVSEESPNLIPRDPGHIDGYDTFIPRFSISYGGQVHDFDGTVEEAVAGMEALYPGYTANLTAKRTPTLKEHAALEPTQAPKFTIDLPPLCIPVAGQDWEMRQQDPLLTGIQYLINLDTTLTPAPYSCGRISCSYQAAIYLCNGVSENPPSCVS